MISLRPEFSTSRPARHLHGHGTQASKRTCPRSSTTLTPVMTRTIALAPDGAARHPFGHGRHCAGVRAITRRSPRGPRPTQEQAFREMAWIELSCPRSGCVLASRRRSACDLSRCARCRRREGEPVRKELAFNRAHVTSNGTAGKPFAIVQRWSLSDSEITLWQSPVDVVVTRLRRPGCHVAYAT